LTDKSTPPKERHGDKTKLEILKSSKKEFLSQGFQGASLRTIAKNAGLTTGAVYTHFKDKTHLFETLVAPIMEGFLSLFTDYPTEYFDITHKGVKYKIPNLSSENRKELTNFIYEHFDEFKLLSKGPEGFNRRSFVKTLSDAKVKALTDILTDEKKSGSLGKDLDPELLQALVRAFYFSASKMVEKEMDQERAEEYMDILTVCFNAGLEAILNYIKK
jgi:AcrR family transcriptional regulator